MPSKKQLKKRIKELEEEMSVLEGVLETQHEIIESYRLNYEFIGEEDLAQSGNYFQQRTPTLH